MPDLERAILARLGLTDLQPALPWAFTPTLLRLLAEQRWEEIRGWVEGQ